MSEWVLRFASIRPISARRLCSVRRPMRRRRRGGEAGQLGRQAHHRRRAVRGGVCQGETQVGLERRTIALSLAPLPLRSATSASEGRSPSGGGPFTRRRSRAADSAHLPSEPPPGGPERPLRAAAPGGKPEVAQGLPRTCVEAVLDGLHGPVRHLPEVRALGEPLPNQLVQAALPGVVRAGEEEPRAERLRHPGMAGELLAVVRSDRVGREGTQHAGHRRGHRTTHRSWPGQSS